MAIASGQRWCQYQRPDQVRACRATVCSILLGMIVTALAVIAVAAGRYVLGLLATFGAVATSLRAAYHTVPGLDVVTSELHYQPFEVVLDFAILEATFWPLPLALLLIVPLILWRAPGTRRPLAWLPAPLMVVFLLPTDYVVTIVCSRGRPSR